MKRTLVVAATLSLAGLAQAQQWPGKPVRAIVNVAAGGVADVTMRVLAPRLGELLGQPVVVENRAGGDGYIGLEAVTRADADGHTLAYSPGSVVMMTLPGEYASVWPSASARVTASRPM